jgi:hypothetical protein
MTATWISASRLAVFAVLSMVLMSCTVVVDERQPLPESGPRYCTREYEPVCARRGGDRQTFSNACRADVAGYRVISYGECRRGGGENREEQSCTREYRPVCAVNELGAVRDFPNACEARAARFRVVGQGQC